MLKSINGGQLPQRATKYSAGFDVFANEDVVIGAGETKVIRLGICLDDEQIENMHNRLRGTAYNEMLFNSLYLELHPRSSLRVKGFGGGVGIIDMDYRDEIKMVIHNPVRPRIKEFESGLCQRSIDVTNNFKIKRGDKIGQLILKRHEGWLFPAEYTKDEERTGGFGSTNANVH